MSGWIIRTRIPYEGLHEEQCDSAKEVVDRIKDMSGLDLDDVEGIVPVGTTEYDPWEFVEAFGKGEVV